jgi:hypothetical protein
MIRLLLSLSLLIVWVQAELISPFKIRFQTNVNGNIEVIGNTLLTAPKKTFQNGQPGLELSNDKIDMRYVKNTKRVKNSSSSTLTLPESSTVKYAALYWGARSKKKDKSKGLLSFKVPGGKFKNVTALEVHSATSDNYYSAVADVTTLVKKTGSGEYTIANVQSEIGKDRFAGWSLVVVYENSNAPLRSMTLFDGYAIIPPSLTVDIEGFNAPKDGDFSAFLSTIAFEGDMQRSGDALLLNGKAISDAVSDKDNFFNSRMSRYGKLMGNKSPNYINQLGLDVKQVDITGLIKNADTKAKVTFKTEKDHYQPVALAFVTDYNTDLKHTQTVLPKGDLKHFSQASFHSVIENLQTGTVTNALFEQTLPEALSFVKGSFCINGKAIIVTENNKTISTVIEKIAAKSKVLVEFKVKIEDPSKAEFGSTIQTQSHFKYLLDELGVNVAIPSDSNTELPDVQSTDIHIAKAPDNVAVNFEQHIDKQAPYNHHDMLTVDSTILNLSAFGIRNPKLHIPLSKGIKFIEDSVFVDDIKTEYTKKANKIVVALKDVKSKKSQHISYKVEVAGPKQVPYSSEQAFTNSLHYQVANAKKVRILNGTKDQNQSLSFVINENVRLNKADKFYQDGNYSAAQELYEELFYTEMDSIEYNHKLAQSATRTGDSDEAQSAYDRLLIMDERIQYNFELAELYIGLEMLTDALVLVKGLKVKTGEHKLKKQTLLDIIEDKRDRAKHTLVLKAGVAYDDNVQSLPEPDQAVNADELDKVGDLYVNTMGSYILNYDLGKRSKYFLQNTLLALSNIYMNEESRNLIYMKESLALGYNGKRYTFLFPFDYDYVVFGGNSLLSSVGVSPSFKMNYSKTISSTTSIKYQKKNYSAVENIDKGSHNIILAAEMNFSDKIQTINGKYTFQNASYSDSSSAVDFIEYISHTFNLRYGYNLTDKWIVSGKLNFKHLAYSSLATDSTETRSDTQSTVGLSIVRKLWTKSKVDFQYNFLNSSSNNELSNYIKNTYILSLQMLF